MITLLHKAGFEENEMLYSITKSEDCDYWLFAAKH